MLDIIWRQHLVYFGPILERNKLCKFHFAKHFLSKRSVLEWQRVCQHIHYRLPLRPVLEWNGMREFHLWRER